MNYLVFNTKKYVLDVKAIIDFCLVSEEKNIRGNEITEGYEKLNEDDDILTLTSRVIRENTDVSNPQNDMIAYDFIKMVLSILLGQEENSVPSKNFSFVLAFNTLLSMGFLKEV